MTISFALCKAVKHKFFLCFSVLYVCVSNSQSNSWWTAHKPSTTTDVTGEWTKMKLCASLNKRVCLAMCSVVLPSMHNMWKLKSQMTGCPVLHVVCIFVIVGGLHV